MSDLIMPGADRAQLPADKMRRLWIQKHAAISAAAIDLLLEMSLGPVPPDAVEWPRPTWAGPVQEPAYA